jgi:CSLREA domain-containing protein
VILRITAGLSNCQQSELENKMKIFPCSPISLLFIAALGLSGSLHATTYTVTSVLDGPDLNPGDNICASTVGPNSCTLRAAIMEANAHTGSDTIEFSLGLISINIVNLNTPLPTITDNVTIDGTTAPGYNNAAGTIGTAPPSVYINGSALTGSTADGFRVGNPDLVWITAIGIVAFPDNGIELVSTENIQVDKNWIGIDRTGGTNGNGGSGIYMQNCDGCKIGQQFVLTTPATKKGLGNLITNNGEDGIYVVGGGLNRIMGNWIGTSTTGGAGNGNGGHGIFLEGTGNFIGDVVSNSGTEHVQLANRIANNQGDGIRAAIGNQTIYTNDIFNNAGAGVVLASSGNKLGFNTTQRQNFVYQNAANGVVVSGPGNWVHDNWINNNTGRGIYLTTGTGNNLSRNTFYGNSSDAIRIDGNSNTVSSNIIGRLTSSSPGHASNGIVLASNSNSVNNNDILKTAANGILVSGTDNTVSSNTVESASADGILVSNGSNDLSSNTLIKNLDDGIDFSAGTLNIASTNKVGTIAGGADLGNLNNGIRVRATATNVSLINNTIGFNLDGIRLEGNDAKVCGNDIGLGPANEPAGNDSEGIRLLGNSNIIGATDLGCAGNTIGFNQSDGIQIEGQSNIIRDNSIGGMVGTDWGNVNGGILLTTGAASNHISWNDLNYNGNDGVRIGGLSGTGNRIEFNTILSNGDIGIDLLDDGITANDAGDGDSGPNNLQNKPEIISITSPSHDILHVAYRVDTNLGNASFPLDVDFYLTPYLTIPQGERWLQRDSYSVTPNSQKIAVIDLSSVSILAGKLVAVTVDANGNTSEFTEPASFTNALDGPIFKNGFE